MKFAKNWNIILNEIWKFEIFENWKSIEDDWSLKRIYFILIWNEMLSIKFENFENLKIWRNENFAEIWISKIWNIDENFIWNIWFEFDEFWNDKIENLKFDKMNLKL